MIDYITGPDMIDLMATVLMAVLTIVVGVVGNVARKYIGERSAETVQAMLTNVFQRAVAKALVDRSSDPATDAARYVAALSPSLVAKTKASGADLVQRAKAEIAQVELAQDGIK